MKKGLTVKSSRFDLIIIKSVSSINLYVFLKQIKMQHTVGVLLKLLLPEIIVNYFEFTSNKKKIKIYLHLKEIHG